MREPFKFADRIGIGIRTISIRSEDWLNVLTKEKLNFLKIVLFIVLKCYKLIILDYFWTTRFLSCLADVIKDFCVLEMSLSLSKSKIKWSYRVHVLFNKYERLLMYSFTFNKSSFINELFIVSLSFSTDLEMLYAILLPIISLLT